MKIYEVGGCVRDRLLGLTPKDIDYVVVGSTPQQMLDNGFQQVGASFPVFLKDGCEYALARTERKTGVGYNGFETSFDNNITLEQDLIRRDLTINSIAYDRETDTIIDPYGGQEDLANGILRHTSEAFAEDPVRVLRTARFAARYNFDVADETFDLMKKVVDELDHVPPERIWAEFEKGLMEKHPAQMYLVLQNAQAFSPKAMRPYFFFGIDKLNEINDTHPLHVRFGVVCGRFQEGDFEACRIPKSCRDVGELLREHFTTIVSYRTLSKERRLKWMYAVRAFNRPQLIEDCLTVASFYGGTFRQIETIKKDLAAVNTVNAGEIAKKFTSSTEIKDAIFRARLDTFYK